jgi:predicted nuclease of predicted toxin-antitoxin system
MRFLIDANMPRSIIALVTKFGHEVEFARDIDLGAAPDQEIAARAQASGAALLTRDLDFADVRRYPPALYSGIIVLRLPDGMIAKDIVRVTERFLQDSTFVGNVAGRLAIVEQNRGFESLSHHQNQPEPASRAKPSLVADLRRQMFRWRAHVLSKSVASCLSGSCWSGGPKVRLTIWPRFTAGRPAISSTHRSTFLYSRTDRNSWEL